MNNQYFKDIYISCDPISDKGIRKTFFQESTELTEPFTRFPIESKSKEDDEETSITTSKYFPTMSMGSILLAQYEKALSECVNLAYNIEPLSSEDLYRNYSNIYQKHFGDKEIIFLKNRAIGRKHNYTRMLASWETANERYERCKRYRFIQALK